MVREQIERKRTHRRDDEEVVERASDGAASAGKTALVDEIDDILDEIDAVLEKNAEEFVKSFVQKGGE
jgi:prokaryotic ubiquitin-like protein Pup